MHYISPEKGIEVNIEQEEGIYEPSDDTFLLLDALDAINRPFGRVLELGAGTGIIGIYCAKRGSIVTAVDINESALALAEKNAGLNGVAERMKFIRSDLFENVAGVFDTIVFNPPYLPEEGPEDIALDGGSNGYELAERFLRSFKGHIKEDGRCYLLLSSIDCPERVLKEYKHRVVAEKSFFFERLYVYELAPD